MKKLVCLLLALVMVLSLAACRPGGPSNTIPSDTHGTDPVNPVVYKGPDWEALAAMDHDEASEALYERYLGGFYAAYTAAKQEGDDLDLRMALMAIAEAKLMESGMFLPVMANGGNYAMNRMVPRTNAATTLWGMDNYRYHTLLVANELIKADDRAELVSMWGEAESADAYRTAAKEYLLGKGYTLSDTYNTYSGFNINIWDVVGTSYTSDSMFCAGTYDGLMEYDAKGVLQPALATSYDVSEDQTVYTFHIREGVQWVDQQGSKVGEVTADDWVAAMEHLTDNNEELGWLLSVSDGCGIKNYDKYIAGECKFEDVGVKAVDKYTLQYTLEAPFAPFVTMLGYSIFAPMNRDFYRSQGGTFGAEGEQYTAGNYGKTPANIAYCGPYLVKNYTYQNMTRYEVNPTYWNIDSVNIKVLTYSYNDGSDATRAYEETKTGTVSGCGFNASALERAKAETPEGESATYFDLYAFVTAPDATTFCGWLNGNRGTWANYNDESVGVSSKKGDDEQIARTREAMANQHFRLAITMATDRGGFNAARVGEDLKYAALRNSYTPGTFLYTVKDVTVNINGTPTTFKAGTAYGEIEQAQLDADGVAIKVWSPEADNGAGSGDGFDGWYNAANAAAELEKAIAELAQIGVEISAQKPIVIDYPYYVPSDGDTNAANVIKQSIEEALGGKVTVNLVRFDDDIARNNATYRISSGNEANYDFAIASGWGPDYGDAQSYLDTIQPYGYMTKLFGLF